MYQKTLTLRDHERPAIMNMETGEIQEIVTNKPRNPDAVKFAEGKAFIKTFPKAWDLLYKMTTPLEYKIAMRMSQNVKMMTNSLEPLNDETTYQELADSFSISRAKAFSAFKKLFELGVYGKFEVYDSSFKHTKYWVFNPYLSINGAVVSKTTLNLFSTTIFAKV